ncbi:MAG: hypothetical protein SFV17_22100 [Candidatus Obscuribacter sp.]|nr:hypothetical protein [Candidatus Obscuribacter sp.]
MSDIIAKAAALADALVLPRLELYELFADLSKARQALDRLVLRALVKKERAPETEALSLLE